MWLSLLCWVARWPRRTQCVHPVSRSLRPSPRMPIHANMLCYFCRSPLSHSCADCGLLELRRRRALADRAAAAQAVAAPPRPNPSARACCCRRRRRSTRCPCVVRVALCMCMSYVCGPLCHTLEPLSMIVDRYSGLDGSGGPRRRLVTDRVLFSPVVCARTARGALRRRFNLRSSLWPAAPGLSLEV